MGNDNSLILQTPLRKSIALLVLTLCFRRNSTSIYLLFSFSGDIQLPLLIYSIIRGGILLLLFIYLISSRRNSTSPFILNLSGGILLLLLIFPGGIQLLLLNYF